MFCNLYCLNLFMAELLLLENPSIKLNDLHKSVLRTQQDIAQCFEWYEFDYNFAVALSISKYFKTLILSSNWTIFSDNQLESFYREYSWESIYDRFSRVYDWIEGLVNTIWGNIVPAEFNWIFPYHRTLWTMYKTLSKWEILFWDLILKKKWFDLIYVNWEFAVWPITQKTDLLTWLFVYIIFWEYILRNWPISDDCYYNLISIAEQISLDLTVPWNMLIDSYKYYLQKWFLITEIIRRLSNKFMISPLNVSLRFVILWHELSENYWFQYEILKISQRRKETIESIYWK